MTPAGAFALVAFSFTGYGWELLRLGRGGGTCSPVPFFWTFRKYFCACERIWITVFVPTKLPIFFQSRWYSCSALRNLACSSGVQLSRCFVMVYGFRGFFAGAPAPRRGRSPPR